MMENARHSICHWLQLSSNVAQFGFPHLCEAHWICPVYEISPALLHNSPLFTDLYLLLPPAQVCTSLKFDRVAGAPFLSSGGKHRQHYQRPQLAPLSIKSPLSSTPASVMSQRLPYLPRPLGFIANLQFMAKLWSEDKLVLCQGGQQKKVTSCHRYSSLPTRSVDANSSSAAQTASKCYALYWIALLFFFSIPVLFMNS